ncbi:geranylgeranyl pyrophosphate synthase, chloroplastic-like [Tripterygium wilfordii]|uniref:geranylgeranyl pyrophosphate synthase, chloroplastic-like n=1 Tax=Tripterygium wilfordii TaxID=458696 RepID=UPI0018F7F95A|nr:geranylgeranyl pyrophosphate synthase, chloroplastic-like [Tripterygium wilfordii]
MAFSLVKNLINVCEILASPHLYLDEKTITTNLEFMVTQFEDYITMKLERANDALDELLPLRVHGKLVAIALLIFKIVVRSYTSMRIHVSITIFLLKLALKFIFAVSWISKLEEPNTISTDLESNGSRVFQLEDYMKCKVVKVNRALAELVPAKGGSEKICNAMAYSLLAGGKRIRSILCIASCECVGGDESSAMAMACAMEIIHAASLTVDDLPCMDDDDPRRGNPSNHKTSGESVAILASAALSCLAFEHIVSKTENVPQDRMVQAISELASAVGLDGLLLGQFLDLDCDGKLQVTLEQLKNIHVLKTRRLLEASVVCGAIIGGASASEIDRLRKYANCIGLVFQVVDEILDETQTAEKLEKTAGKDLASNKATFPKQMGIDGAKNFARELVDQAVQELAHFDAARAAPLKHLAHFILNRPWWYWDRNAITRSFISHCHGI